MSKLAKKFLIFLFLLNSLFFTSLSPALAQTTKDWTNINGGKCVSSTDPDVPTIQGLECIFYNILQVIVSVAGLVFFVMLITNGFKYLFSSSDQKKLAEVNASLTMSIIGIVGIIASWLIMSFIHQVTGVDVLNFVIPS